MRQYRRSAPMPKEMMQVNMKSVTAGRRICTSPHHRGQRWLPIVYFHAQGWLDESKTIPRRIQSWCQTCMREKTRLKGGHKPRVNKLGVKTGPNGYEPQTEAEKERYRQYKKDRYAGMTAEQKADRREYGRIRAEVKRREAGIEPRPLKRLERVFQGGNQYTTLVDELTLDPRPLADLIKNHMIHTPVSVIGQRARTSTAKIEEILACTALVGLDMADRILTGLDCTHMLYVLYPQED